MQGLENFEKVIKEYLDNRAKHDSMFAKSYAKKSNKSIKGCCSYIISEAEKAAKNNATVFTDEQVYGLAVHYYDEDSIKEEPKQTKECKILSPKELDEPKMLVE